MSDYSHKETGDTHRAGYNAWSDYSHKLVWVQWMVRLLTHREGLGTVAGEIDTH